MNVPSNMDKEKMEHQPRVHLSVRTHNEKTKHDVTLNSPKHYSTSDSTVFPMMMPSSPGPESPWSRSPRPTSPPPPSLLYYCIASLHRHDGNIYAISASKGLVFTGSDSNRIRVWKQPDCMDKGYLKCRSGEVRSILCYNDMLFSTHKDHKIRVWNFMVSDTFKSKKVATLPKKSSFLVFNKASSMQQHKDSISCMAYYHSEGLLYTGSHDKSVKAWRVSDRKCVDSFMAHDGKVNSLMVNQDDGSLFSCSSDGSVKIWRRVYREDSHTLTMTLRFQPSPVNTMALSTFFNHCFLYSGSSDGMINFWKKERMCYRFNHGGFLQGHRFAVLCVATVGNFIFSGSEDTTIRVWKREEGSCYHECLLVLDGHRGPVRCIAACMDMEKVMMEFLVYSASLDQTFKAWRVKVLPDENLCMEFDVGKKVTEFNMSPVLSPSWVEKKLRGAYSQ